MEAFEDFINRISIEKTPITDEEIENYFSSGKEEELYELGKLGVLIPGQIGFNDFYRFLYKQRCIESDEELFRRVEKEIGYPITKEQYKQILYKSMFYEFYSIRDGENYRRLKEKLILSLDDALSHDRILQLFSAFEQSLYFPCACGLLTLIDGRLGAEANSSKTKLVALLSLIEEQQQLSVEQRIIIPNLRGYLSLITEQADFIRDDEPNGLNRHWLLHGRDSYDINQEDCINLFIALEMVLELRNPVENKSPLIIQDSHERDGVD